MVTLTPLRKEDGKRWKKTEETKPIFGNSYLGKTWRDLVEI